MKNTKTQKINLELELFLKISKVNNIMSRRFDGRLGGGLGFNDFMILYYLAQSEEGGMRRIDLADKMGLTASGITRLLAPMEKIGLVKREQNTQDARVSLVSLTSAGKILLSERLEKAEIISSEVISERLRDELRNCLKFLSDFSI